MCRRSTQWLSHRMSVHTHTHLFYTSASILWVRQVSFSLTQNEKPTYRQQVIILTARWLLWSKFKFCLHESLFVSFSLTVVCGERTNCRWRSNCSYSSLLIAAHDVCRNILVTARSEIRPARLSVPGIGVLSPACLPAYLRTHLTFQSIWDKCDITYPDDDSFGRSPTERRCNWWDKTRQHPRSDDPEHYSTYFACSALLRES